MSKKGNLFFLIKSLTKSEKRYFKLFCFSEKVNNNYLKLFEAYDKMEELNEGLIKKKFEKENFVKQLHVTKNYLNQLILSSLRSYHAKMSQEAQLKDSLRNIEILFQKELYDQCTYEIKRAEKIAETFEKMPAYLEVLGWKKRLMISKKGFSKLDLQTIITKEKETLEKLGAHYQLWETLSEVSTFNSEEQNKLPEQLKAFPNLALQSKVLRQHLLYSYYTINQNSEKGLQALTDLIELLEEKPQRISEEPGPYLTALNNLIGYYLFSKQHDPIYPILEKVKAIPEKYKLGKESKFSLNLRLRMYNIELEIYRDTKAWEKGVVLIGEVAIFLEQHQRKVAELYFLMLWYQFAYIYFMVADYKNALKWVNEIMNRKFEPNRLDLESYTRLLNLMIHFELGNTFVLKYSVDNTRRFLKKKTTVEPFEKRLLRFFSKISNAGKSDYKTLFKELYQDLFESVPPLVNENVLDYLDFKSWIRKRY